MGTKPVELSSQQTRALFDLLIHHQTYFAECVRFNSPDGIQDYGPPFDNSSSAKPSTAPVLQTLLYRFILPLPGVRGFSNTFWDNIKQLMQQFAEANLSDSYDHAGLGLRRTLATGASALLEYPAKGVYGQLEPASSDEDVYKKQYDLEDPDDLKEAFEILLQQTVYGNAIDELFNKTAETTELGDHPSVIQAAHEYMLIHFASVLHYIFVESPDAIYTQKLMSNLLKLIPWTMLKQSLRIGNAATMINAVTRLFLTKLSITSITNWFGLSNNPDDGMNLMQQILSTVLSWDVSEYKKKLSAVKKSDNSPPQEHLEAIEQYIKSDGDNQRRIRKKSQDDSKSIVTVVFEEASLSILDGKEHDQAIEYMAMSSSCHDREQISKITCHSRPDILTQSIREAIAAYDPIIRGVHKAVDLSGGCQDLENFLYEFLALFDNSPQKKEAAVNGLKVPGSRTPSTAGARTPGTRTPDPSKAKGTTESQLTHKNISVEEFAQVLRNHRDSLHRFLHQMAKNGGAVTDEYRDYVKAAAAQFKSSSVAKSNQAKVDEGALQPQLAKIISELPEVKQKEVLDTVDMYSSYLVALSCVTNDRLRGVLVDDASAAAGPGTFLARWERLLDSTPTTPISPHGKVHYGSSRVHLHGKSQSTRDTGSLADQWKWPEAPDVKVVTDSLGEKFSQILANLAKEHWDQANSVK